MRRLLRSGGYEPGVRMGALPVGGWVFRVRGSLGQGQASLSLPQAQGLSTNVCRGPGDNVGLGPSPGPSLTAADLPASGHSPGWRRGWGLGRPQLQVLQCRLVLDQTLAPAGLNFSVPVRAGAPGSTHSAVRTADTRRVARPGTGEDVKGPVKTLMRVRGHLAETIVPLASVSLGQAQGSHLHVGGPPSTGHCAGQVLGPRWTSRGGGGGC